MTKEKNYMVNEYKYKCGEKVRLLVTRGDYAQGSIGSVTYFWYDGRISVKFDERECLVCLPEDIEPINNIMDFNKEEI